MPASRKIIKKLITNDTKRFFTIKPSKNNERHQHNVAVTLHLCRQNNGGRRAEILSSSINSMNQTNKTVEQDRR